MSPRTGRPPSDDPRTHVLSIRLTAAEYEAVTAAAARAKQAVGPWMRDRVVGAAKRAH